MSLPSRSRGRRAPAHRSTFGTIDPHELANLLGLPIPLDDVYPLDEDGGAGLISTAVPADEWPEWTDARFGVVDPRLELPAEGGDA